MTSMPWPTLAEFRVALMPAMPVLSYRLLNALQFCIQPYLLSTRRYRRECIPLPAHTLLSSAGQLQGAEAVHQPERHS